jgi:hypothetical protein
VEHGPVLHDDQIEEGEVAERGRHIRELPARDEQEPAAAGLQTPKRRPCRLVDVAVGGEGAVVVDGQGLVSHLAPRSLERVTASRRRDDPHMTGRKGRGRAAKALTLRADGRYCLSRKHEGEMEVS